MKGIANRSPVRLLMGGSLLLAAGMAPGLAFADTTTCTQITSLPRSITTPGTYCLASTLTTAATSGTAIGINANNVVLDCNNNEVIATNGPGTTMGVAGTSRTDTVVRNCRFLNFNTGIDLVGAKRVVIQGNHMNNSGSSGMRISGSEFQILDNTITSNPGSNGIRAIASADSSGLVRGNVVRSLHGSGTVLAGIRVTGSGRVFLRDNVVSEIGVPTTGDSFGIVVGSDAALIPSPAVVMNGANFKGEGVRNAGVAVVAGTSKVVCENVGSFGYTSVPANPGCL